MCENYILGVDITHVPDQSVIIPILLKDGSVELQTRKAKVIEMKTDDCNLDEWDGRLEINIGKNK